MSIFIKNVENVQGDERDVIIFSTTFGKNAANTFRRNFGSLGQQGGERRLNVAVTHARRKIYVVTSMPIKDVSDMLDRQRRAQSPAITFRHIWSMRDWSQRATLMQRVAY